MTALKNVSRSLLQLLVVGTLLLAGCSAESSVSITDPGASDSADVEEPDRADDPQDVASSDESSNGASSDDNDGTSDQTGDAPAEQASPDLSELQPGDVVVRLLDAGSEPRVQLRLDLAPTCAELMIIDQTQELSQRLGEVELPSAGPVQSIMTLRLTSTRLGADTYEVTGEIVSAQAGPDTDAVTALAMNEQFAALEGVRTIAQMTDRAVPIPGTSRTEGTDALGELGEMMDTINNQISSPLPEEAIGVGGSWETINVIELQGLALTTTTVQTIESIDGAVITTSVSATQTVAEGAEMVVPGLNAEVLQWDNITSGSTVIDLQSIVPVTSSATVDAYQSFATDDVGGTLNQDIAMQMNVEGQLEDGCAPRPGGARP